MVSLRWAWAPEPASWLEGTHLPENPTLGRRRTAPSPFYPWDWFPAYPKGAMMSIKAMHVTGHAMDGSARHNAPPA